MRYGGIWCHGASYNTADHCIIIHLLPNKVVMNKAHQHLAISYGGYRMNLNQQHLWSNKWPLLITLHNISGVIMLRLTSSAQDNVGKREKIQPEPEMSYDERKWLKKWARTNKGLTRQNEEH